MMKTGRTRKMKRMRAIRLRTRKVYQYSYIVLGNVNNRHNEPVLNKSDAKNCES